MLIAKYSVENGLDRSSVLWQYRIILSADTASEVLPYDKFRIKSRCKTPLSFKLWFPAANLKNICRGRCSHRPAGTHLPPNIPPQPSHHLKSQGRAFPHSPDFNLSSLWQHRTIPALRLKHRSGGRGTASALQKCSIRHPVLSALLA